MVTIGVEPLLISSDLYEHICLENIKKLQKSIGKCENQQQYKAILGAAMVSTPELLMDNSPMSLSTSTPVNNQSDKIYSVKFLNYWMSNSKLLSTGWVLINEIPNLSEQNIFCGRVFQIGMDIQNQFMCKNSSI